jgi:ABC-type lipoprotein release transport system permease subunit
VKAAIRHLKRNRGRTILTLLAVLIPVYFLIFMFGFASANLGDMFNTATRIDTGHFQIRHEAVRGLGSAIPLIRDPDAALAVLDGIDGIEWQTVRLDLPAFASAGDRSQTVYLQGVIPEEIGPISTIGKLVVEGTYLTSGQDGVVIGEELADLLKLGVGDELVLLGAHPEAGIGVLKAPVVGIYSAPAAELGRTVVHAALTTAQRLARSPRAATAIIGRVEGVTGPWNADRIETVTAQFAGALPEGLEVLGWQELAPHVAGYMRVMEPALLIFAAVFFGLGALVVVNTLYLSVMERTRELGLILSLGATRWRVMWMILIEAALIAVVGAFSGALAGVGVIWIVEAFGGIPLWGTAVQFMKAVGMNPVLHMKATASQVILAAASMAGVAVLAAWVPAYRASKLEPVEAMRYVE